MSAARRLLIADMTRKGEQSKGQAYLKELHDKLSPESIASYTCEDDDD